MKTEKLRMCYVLNARFPTKKAYGIQTAKMCEAFIGNGVALTLIIPNTRASRQGFSVKEFYDIGVEVSVKRLPGLDWYAGGRFAFFLSSLVFMASSFIYVWWMGRRGKVDVVHSIDMDTFSYVLLPFTGVPCTTEMQDMKPRNLCTRLFFKRSKIVAINTELRRDLARIFGIPQEKIIAEQNGVDTNWFEAGVDKKEARESLGLPLGVPIGMYVGRFYDWKGIDVLVEACKKIPHIQFYVVGGTEEEFKRGIGVNDIPQNMHIMGECKRSDVPRWLSAGDALVVMGSKRTEGTYLYRSPMKTYEYMAMRRPVVASAAPALLAIVSPGEALFYEPDDPDDLAQNIERAVTGGTEIEEVVERAYQRVQEHTWNKRAERILALAPSPNA